MVGTAIVALTTHRLNCLSILWTMSIWKIFSPILAKQKVAIQVFQICMVFALDLIDDVNLAEIANTFYVANL